MQQTCSRSKKEYGIQEKFKITYNNKKLFQVFHVPTWCFHMYKTWQFFQLKCMCIGLAIQIMCTKCGNNIFFFFCVQKWKHGEGLNLCSLGSYPLQPNSYLHNQHPLKLSLHSHISLNLQSRNQSRSKVHINLKFKNQQGYNQKPINLRNMHINLK